VDPPVPIPNTEVKRCFADGSGTLGSVRVGGCQILALPRGPQDPATRLSNLEGGRSSRLLEDDAQ
jgi:hypothetical protein